MTRPTPRSLGRQMMLVVPAICLLLSLAIECESGTGTAAGADAGAAVGVTLHTPSAAAIPLRTETVISTCDGVTVRGGSEVVLQAVYTFARMLDGVDMADSTNSDTAVFARLLAHLMTAADAEGDSESGGPSVHVVTAQIGANDGKQNDPFHKHMVRGTSVTRSMLRSWVPIMFEPAPFMFAKLNHLWSILGRAKSSACFMTLRQPVMYPAETTCPFYYFNMSHIDGDAKICDGCKPCENHARFMREQLGSLDQGAMQRFFGVNYDRCIATEPLVCGPLSSVLRRLDWLAGVTPRADVLHIDAEGYDGNIIHGILDSDEVAPPIIYFEAKVMRARIRRSKVPYSCAFMDLLDRLDADGRVIVYDNGEDALAIKKQDAPTRAWVHRDHDRCRVHMTETYPKSWGSRKDVHHPTREDKIKIWDDLGACCDTVYKVQF